MSDVTSLPKLLTEAEAYETFGYVLQQQWKIYDTEDYQGNIFQVVREEWRDVPVADITEP